jgi:hypothetical protein
MFDFRRTGKQKQYKAKKILEPRRLMNDSSAVMVPCMPTVNRCDHYWIPPMVAEPRTFVRLGYAKDIQMAKKASRSADADFLRQIRRLAITGVFSNDQLLDVLVLKGGNLLDEVFNISQRTSIDIDLSMDGDFVGTVDELRGMLERGLNSTFSDAGFTIFDVRVRAVPSALSEDMKDYWGGYKVDFKIIETPDFKKHQHDIDTLRRRSLSVGKRGSTKFTIDISKHEHCDAKEMAEVDGYTVFAYTPAMFVCEKLRAICQQMPVYAEHVHSNPSARARDFLDIHAAVEHFSLSFKAPEFRVLLKRTFGAKRVPMSLLTAIAASRDFHEPDFASVKDTVKPGTALHHFGFYFDFVCDRCDELEAFWDK